MIYISLLHCQKTQKMPFFPGYKKTLNIEQGCERIITLIINFRASFPIDWKISSASRNLTYEG